MYICAFMPSFDTKVQYKLDKADHALVFQVLEQSPDVTSFLAKSNFMASNGLIISTSKYPEFKHSKNVLFLRGSDSSNDLKLDVTRFVGNMQRDNAHDRVVSAVQELVNTVKKAWSPRKIGPGYYVPKTNIRTARTPNSFNKSKVIVVG